MVHEVMSLEGSLACSSIARRAARSAAVMPFARNVSGQEEPRALPPTSRAASAPRPLARCTCWCSLWCATPPLGTSL